MFPDDWTENLAFIVHVSNSKHVLSVQSATTTQTITTSNRLICSTTIKGRALKNQSLGPQVVQL